jgi:hypothetical protein
MDVKVFRKSNEFSHNGYILVIDFNRNSGRLQPALPVKVPRGLT